MRYSLKKQLNGISLLELLLVIAIATSILLLGYGRYRAYQEQKAIMTIKQNVALLFYYLNVYYRENCHDENFTVTNQDLAKKWPDLFDQLTPTTLATGYQVSAHHIGNTPKTRLPIFQLSVAVNLNAPSHTLPWYQQRLNAKTLSGKTLKWLALPGYTHPKTNPQLWLSTPELRQFKHYTDTQTQCAY